MTTPRVQRALRVAIAIAALSFAWYGLTFVLVQFGDIKFYSLAEHALLFAYGVVCYAACWTCDRVLGRRHAFWIPLAASYVVAAIGSTLVFVAMRLAQGGALRAVAIAATLWLVLVMFHSAIAGVFFAGRHFQRRIEAATARDKAELRQLQQQVDPHFLFNNLNILSALIREDPAAAAQFSHQLAGLYRYLVQHHRSDWVALDDELAFAEGYARLLTARFGGAYTVALAIPRGSGYCVVPGVLHELLGNVVKHNHGSAAHPVDIRIVIDDDVLICDSLLRAKAHAAAGTGQGLALLSERYRLELGRSIAWKARGDRFVVKVPLVSRP